ncbi:MULTISPECIES: hypothetical protein [Nostoc]|uniref:Bacteriocin n=1 Tax=Nostoc paludosum FACHB-159 TaxID=2692908 RepID=A0ABR8KCI6_9NOSO|nr:MULTISPECIES: hypothetical protein [Nostoc]MBD2679758.1 hypothetical protein [Nostoc sp. FACHB-857]MBD2736005.1 hypothetical protein [Nostoc paludosum FACHB-159]
MSNQISTLDLLVELTTEEQQLLSGGQQDPSQPPIKDGNGDGNDGTGQNNRINRINRLSIPFQFSKS